MTRIGSADQLGGIARNELSLVMAAGIICGYQAQLNSTAWNEVQLCLENNIIYCVNVFYSGHQMCISWRFCKSSSEQFRVAVVGEAMQKKKKKPRLLSQREPCWKWMNSTICRSVGLWCKCSLRRTLPLPCDHLLLLPDRYSVRTPSVFHHQCCLVKSRPGGRSPR